jgi:cysteine desulfurase/selenocysteine lyase
LSTALARLDVAAIRAEFPILSEEVRGQTLAYLDNGATSQKPRAVIEAIDAYYRHRNANVHRGVHWLSQEATAMYEGARERVREFLNARSAREVVFTKGCTEAINLVASSWGRRNLKAGDVVISSVLEHHSNIVPWQLIAQEVGATVVPIPINGAGEYDVPAYAALLRAGNVKMVALQHVSNAIGTIHPLGEMTALAHSAGAKVLIDGAQAAPHLLIDVQRIEAEFYVFSPHKAYGPTGVGVLYGQEAELEAMPPYQGGGDMIRSVSFGGTTFADLPAKFEAGTPPIAAAIGLGAAIEFLETMGDGLSVRARLRVAFERIGAHEAELLAAAEAALGAVDGLTLFGGASEKAAIVSFTLEGIHPHDVGTILDSQGIAVRTGHHCCQPLMTFLGVPATTRASFGLYNTLEEAERLVEGVRKVREVFR